MSNSIEKYSFGAKTDNEGKIIVGILSKFFDNRLDFVGEGNTSYHISGGELHCSVLQRDSLDINNLVAMAKRGFKEPWEVAPDGYRLVTEEERIKYKKMDMLYMIFDMDNDGDIWELLPNAAHNWHNSLAYAVPLDFTFEPVVKELTVAEISEKLGYDVKVVR